MLPSRRRLRTSLADTQAGTHGRHQAALCPWKPNAPVIHGRLGVRRWHRGREMEANEVKPVSRTQGFPARSRWQTPRMILRPKNVLPAPHERIIATQGAPNPGGGPFPTRGGGRWQCLRKRPPAGKKQGPKPTIWWAEEWPCQWPPQKNHHVPRPPSAILISAARARTSILAMVTLGHVLEPLADSLRKGRKAWRVADTVLGGPTPAPPHPEWA